MQQLLPRRAVAEDFVEYTVKPEERELGTVCPSVVDRVQVITYELLKNILSKRRRGKIIFFKFFFHDVATFTTTFAN